MSRHNNAFWISVEAKEITPYLPATPSEAVRDDISGNTVN